MTQVYDVIVVGAGGMGSAAFYHLAKAGQRVLAIERFELGHSRGSSHGETRIIRKAYFEGAKYVPLVRTAYSLWHELSFAAGRPLIFRTGSLEMSEPGHDFVERSRASCVAHGLPYELLDTREVKRRFPAFHLASGTCAIFQPDGGYVLSEAAIAAHARLAVAAGGQLHTGETVLDYRPTGHGGIEVRTDRARYSCGQLVLTTGPWMSALVPALAGHLATFKQAIAWFTPKQPELFEPVHFPVFIHFGDHGEFYGFPAYGASGVKVGGPHFGREAIDPDNPDRNPSPGQLAGLQGFLARTLPDLAGPPNRATGCIYTKTPDEDFIIDQLPGTPQVLVVSPCSGHGYKFAPVIGEIITELVTKGQTRHDISPFAFKRFGVTAGDPTLTPC